MSKTRSLIISVAKYYLFGIWFASIFIKDSEGQQNDHRLILGIGEEYLDHEY